MGVTGADGQGRMIFRGADGEMIVVDDTIVRGTTTPRVVAMLRKGGAREVHMRITSPPITHPCFYGVDMATRGELIAAHLDIEVAAD